MPAADPRAGSAPGVSVVIPARNRLPLLRYLLTSLQAGGTDPGRHEIIVVDDGSGDGTEAWLSGQRPPGGWTVVRHQEPRGRAQARNAGLRVAGGEIVLFLDADVLAPPSLLPAHDRLHRERTAPCCVTGHPWFWREVRTWRFPGEEGGPPGPVLDPALVRDWPALLRWAGGPLAAPGTGTRCAPPDAAPFLWCVTRALSVRRDVLLEIGGFDERFTGYGLEDWELGYRLMRAGVDILADPDAAVLHQAHPPADRGPRDLPRNYAVFLEAHPDAEVGLMPLVPPWAEPAAYARLCVALGRLRGAAPGLHAALAEAAVAFGWSWVRSGGRAAAPMGWTSWTARWGHARVRRILDEQVRMLGDATARPALAAFQRVVGL